MSTGDGRRFSARAADIRAGGAEGLDPLPTPQELAAQPDDDRRRLLEGLRGELYALASLLADLTVERVLDQRGRYPPYGLARSMHSESRLLVADPEPVRAGAIDSFRALGKAYLDTLVFHLDRQFKEQLGSGEAWMIHRLEQLLALYRVPAGPAGRARMKNGFSFMYGGLHFGVSVCVQLTEVMARLLESSCPDMAAAARAATIRRSTRPAYRLAALNLDHVIPVYQSLHWAPRGGAGGAQANAAGWMDAEKFEVHDDGGSWSVDLAGEAFPRRQGRPVEQSPTTYPTQGCPARVSATGGPSAIAVLWRWGVELAHDTGLLGPASGETGAERGERGDRVGGE